MEGLNIYYCYEGGSPCLMMRWPFLGATTWAARDSCCGAPLRTLAWAAPEPWTMSEGELFVGGWTLAGI